MPIQPIAPLQSNARNLSALDSLLSRGGASFDTAIQNAVQIGRDLSNRQSQQERNFLTEQRRGINLYQRKAENAQQDFEDKRTYDEGVRRFDLGFEQSGRQFDLRREDLATGRDIQQLQYGQTQDAMEDRFTRGLDATAEQNRLRNEATITAATGKLQAKAAADAAEAEGEEALNQQKEQIRATHGTLLAQAEKSGDYSKVQDYVRANVNADLFETSEVNNFYGDAKISSRTSRSIEDVSPEKLAQKVETNWQTSYGTLLDLDSEKAKMLRIKNAGGSLNDYINESARASTEAQNAKTDAAGEERLPAVKPGSLRRKKGVELKAAMSATVAMWNLVTGQAGTPEAPETPEGDDGTLLGAKPLDAKAKIDANIDSFLRPKQ